MLAIRPPFSLHDGRLLQVPVPVDLSQYKPESEVHLVAPQKQIRLFGSFPLICVHSSADRQRQDSEEEQDVPEEESGLYLRSNNLDNREFEKHPGGESGLENSFAVVSLKPRLLAAVSHVALSVIPPLPDTEPHVPLLTCEYATE